MLAALVTFTGLSESQIRRQLTRRQNPAESPAPTAISETFPGIN